jgi:lysine 2,3-aminomutase
MPSYLISQTNDKVILRNFEGVIATYSQPTKYDGHDSENCEYCADKNMLAKDGIATLLNGDKITLQPEGLRRTSRNSEHH